MIKGKTIPILFSLIVFYGMSKQVASQILVVTPDSLDFNTQHNTFDLYVSNGDTASLLTWSATVSQGNSWILIDPAEGTTLKETDRITVSIDRTKLTPHENVGSVDIRSNDGTKAIKVIATRENQFPALIQEIPDIDSLQVVDGDTTIDLDEYFTDPDGDLLTYEISELAGEAASAVIVGNELTITPEHKKLTTAITITASDGYGGSVDDTFDVTVVNSPPQAISIPKAYLTISQMDSASIELKSSISDADNDSLTFSIEDSSNNIANAILNVDGLTVKLKITDPKDEQFIRQRAIIEIKATDDDGATDSIEFQVFVNYPPKIIDIIPTFTLTVGGPDSTFDLAKNIVDPERGILDYPEDRFSISVGDTLIVDIFSDTMRVLIDKSQVPDSLIGIPEEEADVTIVARDEHGGYANFDFKVALNDPPIETSNRFEDLQLKIDKATNATIKIPINPTIQPRFIDPDMKDILLFSYESSDTGIAKVSIFQDTLIVSPGTRCSATGFTNGSAIIKVIASDYRGDHVRGGHDFSSFQIVMQRNFAAWFDSPVEFQSVVQEDTPLPLKATIFDPDLISDIILHCRQGGGEKFDSTGCEHFDQHPVSAVFNKSIPKSYITNRGAEFYIEIIDSEGFSSIPDTFGIQVRTAGVTNEKNQPAESYRLFSIPIKLDSSSCSAQSVLVDYMGLSSVYDKKTWRFLEPVSDSEHENFPEYTPDLEIQLKKAYWLIVKNKDVKIKTGGGISGNPAESIEILLESGWNYIGNPFNFPARVKVVGQDESLSYFYTYTGGWSMGTPPSSTILQPFEGCVVWGKNNSPGILYVNPSGSASKGNLAKDKKLLYPDDVRWTIRISAHSENVADCNNIAGLAGNASEGCDGLDSPEPPTIGEFISVYFPHPEWALGIKNFTTDFRPESDGYVWDFECKTNIRDKITLTFEDIDSVPQEFEVWLLDEAINVFKNLRKDQSYSIAGSANQQKKLKLVVATSEYMLQKFVRAPVLPNTFELAQNFPNPFNPTTTIRYGLPYRDKVTVIIYNALGEHVATLVDNKIQEAGYHTTVWNGRNDQNISVANGLYLYQMIATNFVMTKKMILVR